jgi:Subtilase family
MRRRLVTCLGLVLLLTGFVRTDDDDREELIIRAQPGAIQGIADRYGLTLLRSFDQANQNLFLLLCPREDDDDEDEFECDDDLIAAIAADPDVENVAENDDLDVPELPGTAANEDDVAGTVGDDTVQDYFGTTVWTQFAGQPAGTIVSTAQAHTVATGAGVVAIIDTGADYDHPVLQPALIPGFDFFTNTVTTTSELADLDPETATILDQSTSAILEQDDVVLVNQSTSAILEQGAAQQLDPSQLPAAFGHGTMVAGLVRLVAPTATIMPLRAFRPDGTSTTFEILRAIYYAADNGADVINMSFSFPEANSELQRALDYATSRGVVAVASAGNTGNRVIVYPAAFPNVMGVASTTNQDTRSSFSNYGADLVTLAAPGEALITTYPGGNYAGVWGTSFSAALVSGATALLKQVNPGLDQAGAETALSQTQPIDPELGAGRLDLLRALGAVPPPAPLSVALNQATFRPIDTLVATVRAVEGVVKTPVDAYVLVQAGSAWLSLQSDGRLVPGVVPIARRVVLPSGSVAFSFPLATAPLGSYTWLAGITVPGTLTLVAPIEATPFSIVP